MQRRKTLLALINAALLPLALVRVLPALLSQIVLVMLGSAVCGQISAQELSDAANLTKAGTMITNATFQPFTVYACVALMYFALCWPVSAASRKLERSFRRGH